MTSGHDPSETDDRAVVAGLGAQAAPEAPSRLGVDTVEALVRAQMANALGGRRGMAEVAVPGILFTVLWLSTRSLPLALGASLVVAVAALVVRLAQRQTLQFCLNALVGIGIGYLFVRIAASSGGTESEQALAFFLPGILVSLGYTVLMAGSCLVGWPFIGFLLGSVTGDPTSWHADRQVVVLCSRLTWLFLLPGAIGVALQGPVWLLGITGAIDIDLAVLVLGVLRVGLGWPLRVLAWTSMIWVLTRDRTPIETPGGPAV